MSVPGIARRFVRPQCTARFASSKASVSANGSTVSATSTNGNAAASATSRKGGALKPGSPGYVNPQIPKARYARPRPYYANASAASENPSVDATPTMGTSEGMHANMGVRGDQKKKGAPFSRDVLTAVHSSLHSGAQSQSKGPFANTSASAHGHTLGSGIGSATNTQGSTTLAGSASVDTARGAGGSNGPREDASQTFYKDGGLKTAPITRAQATRLFALVPIIVVTGYILFKRLVLGEPQRRIGDPNSAEDSTPPDPWAAAHPSQTEPDAPLPNGTEVTPKERLPYSWRIESSASRKKEGARHLEDALEEKKKHL